MDRVETIADEVASNTPIAEAYELLITLIGKLILVDDIQIVKTRQCL